MANEYSENDNNAEKSSTYMKKTTDGRVDGQVKGDKAGAESSKALGAEKDDERFDPNKTGVTMPHDNATKLPK